MSEETQAPSKNPIDMTALDSELLRRFVTDTGKILPRKYTGLNAREQRHISRIIKQSRNLLQMK
ncbi:MAG: 30S ribosomal protein S18 [Puniceicoccaceae bacterium]